MNNKIPLPDQIASAIQSVVGDGPVGLHEPTFAGNEWKYVKECLDSTFVSSVGKFVDRFEDESLDFVYVDGDHSFTNVVKDIGLYLPKIKKSGFIGGHDYSPEHPGVKEAIQYFGFKNGLFFADTSWLAKL